MGEDGGDSVSCRLVCRRQRKPGLASTMWTPPVSLLPSSVLSTHIFSSNCWQSLVSHELCLWSPCFVSKIIFSVPNVCQSTSQALKTTWKCIKPCLWIRPLYDHQEERAQHAATCVEPHSVDDRAIHAIKVIYTQGSESKEVNKWKTKIRPLCSLHFSLPYPHLCRNY